MKFGRFEILPFVEQQFRLDGGTMFGVVPKKLWGRLIPSDDNNLILMETNLFLLTAYGKHILLDTGLGDCLTPAEKKVYGALGRTNMENALKNVGFTADDVDIVFLTHLHTDHAGGAIECKNGTYMPRFRKARYIVQKTEWQDALHPDERTAAVYNPERLYALEKAGQIDLIEGDTDLMPGIKAVLTGGHTSGHQAIEAASDGVTVVYYADIVPSSHHIKVPYVASVDLFPLETMAVKRKLVRRLLDGNGAIMFDHDITIKIGRLTEDEGRVIVEKIE
jgi:glyoxylase-like metal-dependent hydrolase (beta-lactamase superfamily II)